MKSHHRTSRILVALSISASIAGTAVIAAPAAAQVSIGVGISLPPIAFPAPPALVVLPGTYVYAVPDVSAEIYFVDGYWWRPWQGGWYRSSYYDRGWAPYSSVPYFYTSIRHDWRDDYHRHRWHGDDWNYERVPYQRVQQNWSSWKQNNYWEREKSWGVPAMKAGKQHRDDNVRQTDSRQRSSEPAVRTQAPAQKRSSQSKAVQPQRSSQPKAVQQQRSSQPKAVHQQRSSQPKAASQQQHRSAPSKATPKAAPQQRSSQPKGVSSSHGGGSAPKSQKQGGQGQAGQHGGDGGGGKGKN